VSPLIFPRAADTLDRVNIFRDFRQHGGRVARPRADLEHFLAAFEAQRLGHHGDDIRLGDRLPSAMGSGASS